MTFEKIALSYKGRYEKKEISFITSEMSHRQFRWFKNRIKVLRKELDVLGRKEERYCMDSMELKEPRIQGKLHVMKNRISLIRKQMGEKAAIIDWLKKEIPIIMERKNEQ